MMRFSGIAVFAALVVAPSAGVAQAPTLEPLKFLLGTWVADPDQSGATGGFTFEMKVQNHVMVRTSFSNTPAAAGKPASRHDDLMMIFIDGDRLAAEYADSEGHVIRYDVKTSANAAVFESGVKTNEPRYRLTYTKNTDGSLLGSFDIAMPAAPDAFKPYLTWKARKRK